MVTAETHRDVAKAGDAAPPAIDLSWITFVTRATRGETARKRHLANPVHRRLARVADISASALAGSDY
jgi:hypothetical protein